MVFAVGLFVFLGRKPAETGISNAEIAERDIEFVDALSTNYKDEYLPPYYGIMRCDESIDVSTPFGSLVYAFLAHASVYDLTQDEKYVEVLKQDEWAILGTLDGRKQLENRWKATITMFHPLLLAHNLLKGKKVLPYENDYYELIKWYLYDFIDNNKLQDLNSDNEYTYVQDTAMMSVAFSYFSKILKEKGEPQERINSVLHAAEEINKKAIQISTTPEGKKLGVRCWLLWSQYNLDKAQGKSTKNFESVLLSDNFLNELKQNELMTANSVQPCMEVMLDLYKERKNSRMLDRFNEFNSIYFGETVKKEESCPSNMEYAIKNKYAKGNEYFISDNAYQIYLISRPETRKVIVG